MDKPKRKELLINIYASMFFSFLTMLVVDVIVVALNKTISGIVFAMGFVFLSVLLSLLKKIPNKIKVLFPVLSVCFLIIVSLVCNVFLISFSNNSKYQALPDTKNEVFSNKKIMLIVPHEDDEFNVAGGLIEQFSSHNSTVSVVYITNGDAVKSVSGEKRLSEAIEFLKQSGVSENNIHFLGYGDNCIGKTHIYNAPENQVVPSVYGNTKTYGLKTHPAYNDGNEYTLANLKSDIKNVILDIKPEIIICSDYDNHIDHKATTLLFEKTMGTILRENPKYHPQVLKAYAYSTCWLSKEDFYSLNIISTLNCYKNKDFYFKKYQTPEIYNWEERIRFPYKSESLSRSPFSTDYYKMLNCFKSQHDARRLKSIISGDKVFWERETSSLTYAAKISTSSGNANYLNDFMLLENNNIKDDKRQPCDGVWIPSKTDSKKEVEITFSSPSDLTSIYLYDSPSLKDNVKKAKIIFDDGSEIIANDINKNGTATKISVDKKSVKSFKVKICKSDSENSGFTEIEAYNYHNTLNHPMIKIIDENDNFVYDYIVNGSGQSFSLYDPQDTKEVNDKNFTLKVSNTSCKAEIKNGKINVNCPEDEETYLTVTKVRNNLSDTVYLKNLNESKRKSIKRLQKLENLKFTLKTNYYKLIPFKAYYEVKKWI